MTWPSGDVDTTGMDSGTDTPPRATFLSWAQKFNLLINHFTVFMQGLMSSATAADARSTLDVPTRTGGNASGTWGINISGSAAGLSGTLGLSGGGTGQTTAAAAFAALKQNASTTESGVVEFATSAEAVAGDPDRVLSGATLRNAVNFSTGGPMSVVVAWCTFNGKTTGTNAPIAGRNVSSIQRISAGSYAVNFTFAMPDGGYAVAPSVNNADSGASLAVVSSSQPPTPTQFAFLTNNGGASPIDPSRITLIFVA